MSHEHPEMDEALATAIDFVRAAATERRSSILVTRTGPGAMTCVQTRTFPTVWYASVMFLLR